MSQPPNQTLTHFDGQGQAHMVDIADKQTTKRIAVVTGKITMQPNTLTMVQQGNHKKGDVLAIARIAGIMACKRCADLIPLCHQIPLTKISIDFDYESDHTIICTAEVHTLAQTGIEIEAFTAVQIALLTIYDMCKAIDRGMVLQDIRLLKKSGGRSGNWTHDNETS